MKEIMRYGVTLAGICMVAAGLLAGAHSLASSKIIAQAKAEEEANLKAVIPEAAHFDPVEAGGEIVYYKALNARKELIGVAFLAQGKGYSSVIETMVGMDPEGKITAIKVINQNETPGLGSRVAEAIFTSKFAQKNIEELSGVEAITGATISSRAVSDSVKKKAEEVKRLIRDAQ